DGIRGFHVTGVQTCARPIWTAVGSFNGAFANVPAHELGAATIKGALARAGVDASEVDEVILGQVLPAGEGQNPARQAAMKSGVRSEERRVGKERDMHDSRRD